MPRSVQSFAEAEQALQADFSPDRPRLREAAALLEEGRLGPATRLLQAHLQESRSDPDALYLLAEAAMRQGRSDAAERLLAQCVASAPDFAAARLSYAQILLANERPAMALEQANVLLQQLPRNALVRRLRAGVLDELEEYESSAGCWRELCDDYPEWPEGWLRYGQALKVLGQQQAAIAAYRKALQIDASAAGAYWGLAASKAFRFADDDVAQMENLLRRSDLEPADRVKLHFALGHAYGGREAYQKSFANYAKGNALHYLGAKHDPERMTRYVARSKAVLTARFFEERRGYGCQSGEAVFIVGMPRSGSTLVEQILASHSQIEGTKELSTLLATVSEHQEVSGQGTAAFDPELLVKLDAAACRELGARYLELAQAHRKTERPFFTDKMPANFAYIGLIQLILPNAKIIDIRRHPMACGFAIFTELFSGAHDTSYRLADIGRAYRNYVELMAHFDRVLPARVYRVLYEELVADPEGEIRRLLDYLGIPFEPACLEFHKTARTVTTRSSEQVRQPIYRQAIERWRNYEQWLGPLKAALGDTLENVRGESISSARRE